MRFIDYRIPFVETVADYRSLEPPQVFESGGVRFPVLYPIMVHRSLISANDWNPNHVAKDKMQLLKTSVVDNGFCFGIVSIFDDESSKFIIVDGYHRSLILGPDWLDQEFFTLIVLNHSVDKRLAATVQFNKARGVHKIDLNAELVKRMVELGVADIDICRQLGIDADELLRMKRNVKIAEIYKDMQFSKSWEVDERSAARAKK